MTVCAQDTVAPPRNPCTAVGLGYAAGWKKTTMNLAVIHTPSSGANAAQWLSAGLVIGRSQVRSSTGAGGEISSPGSSFCSDSCFGIRSTPSLQQ